MKIYIAMKNADMTEGRGPMIPNKYFTKRKYAERYIDTKSGIMGIKRKWSTEKYGDWGVKEVEVIENDIVEERLQKEKERILSKLTKEEISILGL